MLLLAYYLIVYGIVGILLNRLWYCWGIAWSFMVLLGYYLIVYVIVGVLLNRLWYCWGIT